MKVTATINKQDMEVILHRNMNAESQLRMYVEQAGLDWDNAEIFVANYPERGRCLSKSAGYKSVQAGG